jgi:hypothetical protein
MYHEFLRLDGIIEERNLLKKKMNKLEFFIGCTTEYLTLSEKQQDLLSDRLYVMQEYLNVLNSEITQMQIGN